MLQLGLRLHDAPDLPLEERLPLVRQQGFTCVHLALRKAVRDLPCTPAALTPGYARHLRRVFSQNDLDIALLGCYLNLADPDPDRLRAAQQLYCAHIRFASQLGCAILGTETGAPNAAYTFTPACRGEEAFQTLVKNLAPVVRCAEQFGVILAVEPVASHIIWNPQRCRRLLDTIASPNLQVILDPVNLLEPANVGRREEVVGEALELLGPDIAMIHLKDYKRCGDTLTAVGAGTGEMSYTSLLRYCKREKPFLYATLENTTPQNAAGCRAAMQRAYDEL